MKNYKLKIYPHTKTRRHREKNMFCLLKALPTSQKTKRTTNHVNNTNIFHFLRLWIETILHFHLSFYFFNFDILIPIKMQSYVLNKNLLSNDKTPVYNRNKRGTE